MKKVNHLNSNSMALAICLLGLLSAGKASADGTIGTEKRGWMTFDFYGSERAPTVAKPIRDTSDSSYSKILVGDCRGGWDTQSFKVKGGFSWVDYYGVPRRGELEVGFWRDTIFPDPKVSLANDRIYVTYKEWRNGSLTIKEDNVAIAAFEGRRLVDIWVRELYPLEGDFVLRLIVYEKETPDSHAVAKLRTFLRGTFHLDN